MTSLWRGGEFALVFFFYKFLIFNLAPNGCENRTFLKQHTPTFFIFSVKMALFFHIYLKTAGQNYFFGQLFFIKTHEILRKKGFFLDLNFVFQKK